MTFSVPVGILDWTIHIFGVFPSRALIFGIYWYMYFWRQRARVLSLLFTTRKFCFLKLKTWCKGWRSLRAWGCSLQLLFMLFSKFFNSCNFMPKLGAHPPQPTCLLLHHPFKPLFPPSLRKGWYSSIFMDMFPSCRRIGFSKWRKDARKWMFIFSINHILLCR